MTSLHWGRPVQARSWLEYRSKCGRFLIERIPQDTKHGTAKSRFDYRVTELLERPGRFQLEVAEAKSRLKGSLQEAKWWAEDRANARQTAAAYRRR